MADGTKAKVAERSMCVYVSFVCLKSAWILVELVDGVGCECGQRRDGRVRVKLGVGGGSGELKRVFRLKNSRSHVTGQNSKRFKSSVK